MQLVEQPPQFLHRRIVVVDAQIDDGVAFVFVHQNRCGALAVWLASRGGAGVDRFHETGFKIVLD